MGVGRRRLVLSGRVGVGWRRLARHEPPADTPPAAVGRRRLARHGPPADTPPAALLAHFRMGCRAAASPPLVGDAPPQREVDFGEQLDKAVGVVAVALGELRAHLLAQLRGAAAGLLVLEEPPGRLLRGLEADEAPRALHLGNRVLNAALELEDEDLVGGKEVEPVAKLLVIEAAPGRV